MPFSRAGQLARSAPSARLTDPLALVAENLRNSSHGVLPVFDRLTFGPDDPSERTARVVGLISQKELSRATQRMLAPVGAGITVGVDGGSNGYGLNGHAQNGASSNGHAPALPEESTENTLSPAWNALTARDVMQSDVPYIPDAFSLVNALLMLERHDYPALPVYDAGGRYRGLVSRADLLSAIHGGVRPPLMGGMATPLGVWLTDGRMSGGAPPVGLFLTGLTLAFFLAASQLVLGVGALLINPTWAALAFSGRLGFQSPDGSLLNFVFSTIQALLFLGLFRLFPISGTHAAEHQVVHAVERGLPLEPEIVARMPRAHPRCGTNLSVIAGLIIIGISHLPDVSADWVLILLVATFFLWRAFGTFVQENFTTRPASKKQLESGIQAAKELIEKYQTQQYTLPPLPLRLLNGGLLYVAGGMILGEVAWGFAAQLLARLVLRQ